MRIIKYNISIPMETKTISLVIKRLDLNNAEISETIEVDLDITYAQLQQKILNLLNITNVEEKVFKVRNSEGVLIPLTDILLENSNIPYTIEVTNVHHDVPAVYSNSPLHSVYVKAVKNKMKSMESRIARIEALLPQLKWRRQSLLERTTHTLESRVAFLDRRIDELTPPQWHEYIQNMSISIS